MTELDAEKLFTYKHLPKPLQMTSLRFYTLAMGIVDTVPPCNERDLILHKLWEAKNLAVWCAAQGQEL